MSTKFMISIAGEILFLDESRNRSEGFPPIVGPDRNAPVPTLTWPIVSIDVATADWDEALVDFTDAERAAARVHTVVRLKSSNR